MAEFLTPGQYVLEEEPKIKVAETVSSSIGCIVGRFNKGELGKPVLVSSLEEFKSLFGDDDLTGIDCTTDFFEQGGTRLYVIRVGSALNNVTGTVAFVADPSISFNAKSGGNWSNNYKVTVTQVSLNTCSLREAISASTTTLKVTSCDSWKVGQRVFEDVSGTLTCLGKVVSLNQTVDGLELVIDTPVTSLALNSVIKAVGINVSIKNQSNVEVESYTNLVLEKGIENYWVTKINNSSSVINVVVPSTIANEKLLLPLFGATAGTFILANGTSGTPTKADYITALTDVLPQIDTLANVFVVPEEISTSADIADIFNKATAIATVSKKYFILMYVPVGEESTVASIVAFRNLLNATECGTLLQGYTPVFNTKRGAEVMTPPTGALAGAMARLSIEKGYWFSPAGLHAQFKGKNKVSKSVTDAEQASLNPIGVNCVRTFTGIGVLPWGARTLSSSSAMKYISDRITFNVIEQTILRNNLWSVFQPNDQNLWTSLGISITEYLRTEWKKGALRGASESEAFVVKFGKEVTDWYDVQTGKVHIIIGLATQKPGEFIIYHIYPLVG